MIEKNGDCAENTANQKRERSRVMLVTVKKVSSIGKLKEGNAIRSSELDEEHRTGERNARTQKQNI